MSEWNNIEHCESSSRLYCAVIFLILLCIYCVISASCNAVLAEVCDFRSRRVKLATIKVYLTMKQRRQRGQKNQRDCDQTNQTSVAWKLEMRMRAASGCSGSPLKRRMAGKERSKSGPLPESLPGSAQHSAGFCEAMEVNWSPFMFGYADGGPDGRC